MKKVFQKLVLVLSIIFISFPTYANIIVSPRVLYNANLNGYKEDWMDSDIREYNQFMNAVKGLKTYQDSDIKKTMFSANNKNLLIGHSAAVFACVNAKDILIQKGYDLMGVGGAIDRQLCEWFDALNKTYDNIIIWGAANDIMNSIQAPKESDKDYYKILDRLLTSAYNHLNHDNPNSKIVWVCVRDMEAGLDMPYEYCIVYNEKAQQINHYVHSERHIKCINIPQDTTLYNSAWYMHYTNPEVFRDILDMRYMID